MTPQEEHAVLAQLWEEAKAAGHVWPDYAACEAALESAWGQSLLARECHNLFGQKQSALHPIYQTKRMETREYDAGTGCWYTLEADWVLFPSYRESFLRRMELLRACTTIYGPAMAATNGPDYVIAVSKRWSTDPDRAQKVLEIHAAHKDVFV